MLETLYGLFHIILYDNKHCFLGYFQISDINALLNEKKLEIERLQIDNLRMEDNLRGHLESVKVCLECELMEEKVSSISISFLLFTK